MVRAQRVKFFFVLKIGTFFVDQISEKGERVPWPINKITLAVLKGLNYLRAQFE